MSSPAQPQESNPQTVYLKDYMPPEYAVKTIHLGVDVFDEHVDITANMVMQARPGFTGPIVLQGQQQKLKSVTLNDIVLDPSSYTVTEQDLTIQHTVDPAIEFTLQIETEIDPYHNTALEGFYESKGMLCTQCEAEGFRRIVYSVDRPDNMAVFTTRIQANKARYPVLLANGNLVRSTDIDADRHEVVWHDPHPKPSYLFAMVAGDLAVTKDTFTTQSNREVTLAFYTDSQDQDKIAFALEALKKSMRWDEERYGREYDLDIFMVVAVSHFNMGAMENKGLNVFNTTCVLASPDTTTDHQYANVESIIGHEYFHNWSGNRVTCRDWFQLSLKEGFTVFRDQHFSMEVDSWLVHRVNSVKVMRSIQFAEDAGPMAHPVRPQEFIEINNFYTVTVYDKGAEVVRMIHTLLGDDAFRQGTDRYFARFDGQAVTTEDFVESVTEGTNFNMPLFQRWYDQPGTPLVRVNRYYDADEKVLKLRFEQSYPALPNWQQERLPVPIPVRLGLIANGQPVLLKSNHTSFSTLSPTDGLFVLNDAIDELVFDNVPADAVPSLLRGFSAPVVLQAQLSQAELAVLVAHDEDQFNRWDAAQQIMSQLVFDPSLPTDIFLNVFGQTLQDEAITPEARALICQLPAYTALEQVQVQTNGTINVDGILDGQAQLRKTIATRFQSELSAIIEKVTLHLATRSFNPSAEDRGWRSLRNMAFYYLASLETAEIEARLVQHTQTANNLTDRLAGLRALIHNGYSQSANMISWFAEQYGHEELAMNAWFEVQSSNPMDGCLAQVEALQQHAAFDPKSPNHVRSVVGAFCRGNPRQFHKQGAGYAFLAKTVIEYNESNPQLAARLLGPLTGWRQYDKTRQEQMQKALREILAVEKLAPDLFEVVSKSLGGVESVNN